MDDDWNGEKIAELFKVLKDFWPSLKPAAATAWIEKLQKFGPLTARKAIFDVYETSESTYHPAFYVVEERARAIEPRKKIEPKREITQEEFLKRRGVKKLKDLI